MSSFVNDVRIDSRVDLVDKQNNDGRMVHRSPRPIAHYDNAGLLGGVPESGLSWGTLNLCSIPGSFEPFVEKWNWRFNKWRRCHTDADAVPTQSEGTRTNVEVAGGVPSLRLP